MIIKTFRADTSAEALKKIRQEMSGDAIVLKSNQTQSENGRTVFEVTACLENPTVAQSSVLLDNDNSVESEIIPSQNVVETTNEITIPAQSGRLSGLEDIDNRIASGQIDE